MPGQSIISSPAPANPMSDQQHASANYRAAGVWPPTCNPETAYVGGFIGALQALEKALGGVAVDPANNQRLFDTIVRAFKGWQETNATYCTRITERDSEVARLHELARVRLNEMEAAQVEVGRLRGLLEQQGATPPPCLPGPRPHSHYFHDVRHLATIDIYRMIDLLTIEHPAMQHAFKKVAAAGKRGAKSELQDAQEAIDSINRFIAMRGEDEKK